MKNKIRILTFLTILVLSFLLLTSCYQKEKVKFKTLVGNQFQINVEYDKGSYILQPLYIIDKNQTFEGWYLDNNLVDFPLKLEKDTLLIAKVKNNDGNYIIPEKPKPEEPQPEPNPEPKPNPDNNPKPEPDTNTHPQPTPNNSYQGNYYDSININLNDKDFFLSLNKLIKNYNHVSYNTVFVELSTSDINPNKPNTVWGIYDSKDLQKGLLKHEVWNREHVWPKSRLNGVSISDFHNLRASDNKTNSQRGNLPLVDGKGRNRKIGTGYYPGDEHKGDVARILLHMATCYPNRLKLGRFANDRTMGDINVLLKWHLEDPVDQFEINRNNHIYKIQGNRNPYIDHPEWFEKSWNYLKSIAR